MQGQPVCDRPLGGAIENNDEHRDQEMILAHGQIKITRKTFLSSISLSRLRKPAVTPLQFL
jgi:hypothetical protein